MWRTICVLVPFLTTFAVWIWYTNRMIPVSLSDLVSDEVIYNIKRRNLIPEVEEVEERLLETDHNMNLLRKKYLLQDKEIQVLDTNLIKEENNSKEQEINCYYQDVSPELQSLMKSMEGTLAVSGVHPKQLPYLQTKLSPRLLTHLAAPAQAGAARPAYYLPSPRRLADVVIGVPTVKRNYTTYLMRTLESLLAGLSPDEVNSTLIVVLIGETDLLYVLNVAASIEQQFPGYITEGLFEILSPSPAYYPNLTSLWTPAQQASRLHGRRAKQNLDFVYLAAHCQSRGTYYLMLEDDIQAHPRYMTLLKDYRNSVYQFHSNWCTIEFCPYGGVGRLFRTTEMAHFIVFVQIFYTSASIDLLIDYFLEQTLCRRIYDGDDMNRFKLNFRLRFPYNIFRHIEELPAENEPTASAVASAQGGRKALQWNPPMRFVYTNLTEQPPHTLARAYAGITSFIAADPRKNDIAEFWFRAPSILHRYQFLSSSPNGTDLIESAVVEALPLNGTDAPGISARVGVHPTGFAPVPRARVAETAAARGHTLEGTLVHWGPLLAIRLRITRSHKRMVLRKITLLTSNYDIFKLGVDP